MVNLVDADGSYAERSSDLLTKQSRPGRSLVGVDELTGDDLVAEKRLTVGEMGVRESRVG